MGETRQWRGGGVPLLELGAFIVYGSHCFDGLSSGESVTPLPIVNEDNDNASPAKA